MSKPRPAARKPHTVDPVDGTEASETMSVLGCERVRAFLRLRDRSVLYGTIKRGTESADGSIMLAIWGTPIVREIAVRDISSARVCSIGDAQRLMQIARDQRAQLQARPQTRHHNTRRVDR